MSGRRGLRHGANGSKRPPRYKIHGEQYITLTFKVDDVCPSTPHANVPDGRSHHAAIQHCVVQQIFGKDRPVKTTGFSAISEFSGALVGLGLWGAPTRVPRTSSEACHYPPRCNHATGALLAMECDTRYFLTLKLSLLANNVQRTSRSTTAADGPLLGLDIRCLLYDNAMVMAAQN